MKSSPPRPVNGVVEAAAQQRVVEHRTLHRIDAGKGIGPFGRSRGAAGDGDRVGRADRTGLEVDCDACRSNRVVEAGIAVADNRVVAARPRRSR